MEILDMPREDETNIKDSELLKCIKLTDSIDFVLSLRVEPSDELIVAEIQALLGFESPNTTFDKRTIKTKWKKCVKYGSEAIEAGPNKDLISMIKLMNFVRNDDRNEIDDQFLCKMRICIEPYSDKPLRTTLTKNERSEFNELLVYSNMKYKEQRNCIAHAVKLLYVIIKERPFDKWNVAMGTLIFKKMIKNYVAFDLPLAKELSGTDWLDKKHSLVVFAKKMMHYFKDIAARRCAKEIKPWNELERQLYSLPKLWSYYKKAFESWEKSEAQHLIREITRNENIFASMQAYKMLARAWIGNSMLKHASTYGDALELGDNIGIEFELKHFVEEGTCDVGALLAHIARGMVAEDFFSTERIKKEKVLAANEQKRENSKKNKKS